MNPVRPDPRPAVALLAVVLGGFGFFFWSYTHSLSAISFAASAVMLVRFVRGVLVDNQLRTVGLRTAARVVRVEAHQSNQKHMPDTVYHIVFRFTDTVGKEHENFIEEFDATTADQYRGPGASVNIAYHPKYPEMFRWLE